MQKSDQKQHSTAEGHTREDMQELASHQHGEVIPRQEQLNSIAAKLIAAREARGEKIDQAVQKLKLSKSHLEALEQGNWDLLPDEIYALGFLRQYCQHLQLDLSDDIKQLKNEQYTLGKPLTFPDPPVAPSKKWAWFAGGMFIILLMLFNVINNQDDHQQNPVDTQNSEEELDLASLSPDETGMETPQVHVGPEVTAAPVTHKPIVNLEAANTATSETAANAKKVAIRHVYKFEAVTGAVWIQIFAPNESGTGRGSLLKEVLLQQGQYSSIRKSVDSLWINCGNAPSLRVKVDGKTVADTGSLGGGKKVLRDYHFKIKQ